MNHPICPTEHDPRWQALVARDRSRDGHFVYSVRTTGVYCRPSCGARRPRPENVRFHDTSAEAEQAGFRPCRRCRPNRTEADPGAAVIAHICRRIEQADDMPVLEHLAAEAGYSPTHFHRMFKAVTGLTPRAYALAHRARRVRERLAEGGGTVTEAIYAAGYNSSGRFYEHSDRMLGMTPSDFRDGGANADIRFAVGQSSLGTILVAASERGVCAVLIGDEAPTLVSDLRRRFPKARLVGGDGNFDQVVARVIAHVEEPSRALDLPLDIRGTAFQQRVWQALRQIPPGATATYTDIAERIGAPRAVRAVAGACAANALAVVVPCHRVVRGNGSLSGYRWGVARKRALIERERKE